MLGEFRTKQYLMDMQIIFSAQRDRLNTNKAILEKEIATLAASKASLQKKWEDFLQECSDWKKQQNDNTMKIQKYNNDVEKFSAHQGRVRKAMRNLSHSFSGTSQNIESPKNVQTPKHKLKLTVAVLEEENRGMYDAKRRKLNPDGVDVGVDNDTQEFGSETIPYVIEKAGETTKSVIAPTYPTFFNKNVRMEASDELDEVSSLDTCDYLTIK